MIASFFDNSFTVFLKGLGLLILFFLYFATRKERRQRNIGMVSSAFILSLSAFLLVHGFAAVFPHHLTVRFRTISQKFLPKQDRPPSEI